MWFHGEKAIKTSIFQRDDSTGARSAEILTCAISLYNRCRRGPSGELSKSARQNMPSFNTHFDEAGKNFMLLLDRISVALRLQESASQ